MNLSGEIPECPEQYWTSAATPNGTPPMRYVECGEQMTKKDKRVRHENRKTELYLVHTWYRKLFQPFAPPYWRARSRMSRPRLCRYDCFGNVHWN